MKILVPTLARREVLVGREGRTLIAAWRGRRGVQCARLGVRSVEVRQPWPGGANVSEALEYARTANADLWSLGQQA